MSYKRFAQIKASIRFDNKLRRNRQDPLAPVRDLMDSFNGSLKAAYEPGPFLCVDEQLIEFHGRVKFKQCIPTKPVKFGIKVFWTTDTENTFPLRCLVYVGSQTLPETEEAAAGSIPAAVVLNLAAPYLE